MTRTISRMLLASALALGLSAGSASAVTVYDFFDVNLLPGDEMLATYDLATETLLSTIDFGAMGSTQEGTGVDNGFAYQFWNDGVGGAALTIFDMTGTVVSHIPDFSVMGTGGHGGIGVDNGIVYEFWNDGVGSIALSTYDLATQTLLSTDLDFGPLGFDPDTQAGGIGVDNGIVYQFWNDGAGSIAVSVVDLATEVQLSVDLDFSVMPIGGHSGIGVSSFVVPEPGTGLLLGSGLVGLGIFGRRRRS